MKSQTLLPHLLKIGLSVFMFCLVGCSNFLFANNPCYLVCQSNENAILNIPFAHLKMATAAPTMWQENFLKISPKYAHGDFKYDAKQPKAHAA